MRHVFFHYVTFVWLLLVGLTAASWMLAEQPAGEQFMDASLLSTLMLIIAFIKVRLVGLHFMELRHAPLPLRLVLEVWVVAVCLLVLYFYWQSVIA
jgi:hypothetical protein